MYQFNVYMCENCTEFYVKRSYPVLDPDKVELFRIDDRSGQYVPADRIHIHITEK